MSTLYVIYTVIFILREVLFVSFIIGMLNFERYQIAAKAEAVRIIIQDVEELGEEICNVWGVDYSSSIDDSSKVRSSTGITVNWFTPIGPLNFSLAQPINTVSTDKTQTFQFSLGTTFL